MKKRNYAAERREAVRHADAVMNKMPKATSKLDRARQIGAWGYAYAGFLAGLRSVQRR